MHDTSQPSPRRKGPPSQSLSEISHLFLSELRERQSGGAPKPTRKPPAVSIDLTPSEFARGLEAHPSDAHDDDASEREWSVVLAHHLAGNAIKSVRQYAAHLAAECGRVGLIELGDDGLRLSCFDSTSSQESEEESSPAMEPVDAKRIGEAIKELSWDVSRWLLFLPAGANSDSSRKLLGEIGRWTLLVSGDDEGLVAGYRTLKGLADLGNAAISTAIVDAEDDAQAGIIYRKLSGASKQFLDRPVESEGRVRQADGVAEHVVLFCRASGATQDHWTAVLELAAKSHSPSAAAPVAEEPTPEEEIPEPIPLNPTIMQTPPPTASPAEPAYQETEMPEVLEISAADGSSILTGIISRRTDWVASPVSPPMSSSSKIAVDRQGRLNLLAVADGSLAELETISRAYQWLNENRALVRMALPQMNIDAAAMPRLTLFAEQSLAASLSAIFQGNVTIETYRRVRWGEKTGLLLEAA
jgi:hypothetical protein